MSAAMAAVLTALGALLAELYHYFGIMGSIVPWASAAALMGLFVLLWRRSKVCWTALGLAIAGLVMAYVHSNVVSSFKIDFSKQLQATRQRQAEIDNAENQQSEDSGESEEAEEAKRAEASDKEQDNNTPRDYRQQGKVQRTEGMKVPEKIPIGPGTEDQPGEENVRYMEMHEIVRANRLDRLNLFFARWTLGLAVLLVVVDYFRRLNKTFESYLPLPLGGWLLDGLFPKSHTVCASGGDAQQWKRLLKQAVRKGETFLYFARKDPWPEPFLPRLPGFIPVPWQLDKITCGHGDGDFDDALLFESAWFGRYCFVLVGDGPGAQKRLDALAAFLELRRETRASAAHTVNVLWDLVAPIPRSTLDRLLPLCRETNFRLILAAAEPPGEELAARFEDVVAVG